ncbi:MAG: M48 family metalloprotease [Polyangiales bacterium]
MSEAWLTALRALYPPAWLWVGAWGLLPALTLWAWLSAHMSIWVAGRGMAVDASMHWSEAARRSYPVRAVAGVQTIMLPILTSLFVLLCTSPIGYLPASALALFAWALAWLVAMLGHHKALQHCDMATSLGQTLRDGGMTLALLGPYWVVLFFALILAPTGWNSVWWLTVGACLLLAGALQCGLHVRLWCALGWLRPAPALEARVVALARGTGLGRVRCLVFDWRWANALALPSARIILVSRACCDALSEAQLETVLAHEVGHLQDKRLRGPLPWMILGWLTVLVLALKPLLYWQDGIGFGPALLALGLLLLWTLRWSRRLETHADSAGADAAGQQVYAAALEALYRANATPAVLTGGTHPSLYDRMQAAGVEPDYPRPVAPDRWRVLVAAIVGWCPWFLLAAMVLFIQDSALRPDMSPSRADLQMATLWDAAPAPHLDALADLSWEREDYEASLTYARAAMHIDPDVPRYLHSVGIMQAELDRCTAAKRTSRRLQHLLRRQGMAAAGRKAYVDELATRLRDCHVRAAQPTP